MNRFPFAAASATISERERDGFAARALFAMQSPRFDQLPPDRMVRWALGAAPRWAPV